MKTRKVLFCFLSLLLASCQYGINFEVQNDTNNNIDSLVITNGFNSLKLYNIKLKEKKEGFLDFNKNNPKHDGLHNIQLFMQNSIIRKSFGYYSNGIPSVKSYKLIIKNDTIIIKDIY
mgnify:FL=1|tara:strand:+ start:1184 stop:1537 length:354 start_codon:yes stop_codon:yes gene_type:complete